MVPGSVAFVAVSGCITCQFGLLATHVICFLLQNWERLVIAMNSFKCGEGRWQQKMTLKLFAVDMENEMLSLTIGEHLPTLNGCYCEKQFFNKQERIRAQTTCPTAAFTRHALGFFLLLHLCISYGHASHYTIR